MKTVRLIVSQASGLRVHDTLLPRGANTEQGCYRHLRAGCVRGLPFYFNSTRTTSTSFVRFDAGKMIVTVWPA